MVWVEIRFLWKSRKDLGLWRIYIILKTRTGTWNDKEKIMCEQDAKAGDRGTPPPPHSTSRKMADVSGIRKEANLEPWVRETESGGAARPVTLEKDGRR